MAFAIGVVGDPGEGKTTSLRNLPADESFYLSPFKQDLPFQWDERPLLEDKSNFDTANMTLVPTKGKKDGRMINMPQIQMLGKVVESVEARRPEVKYMIIDDITHMFSNYTLGVGFRGLANSDRKWSRWEDFGADVFQALFEKIRLMRSDLFIIMCFHADEQSTPLGPKLKIQTPGQMLDRQVKIPSYFNYLFYTKVDPFDPDAPGRERYFFATNDDGYRPAKTPVGLFDQMYIPNDMMAIINRIREFKNL